jgi:hypothetical protein
MRLLKGRPPAWLGALSACRTEPNEPVTNSRWPKVEAASNTIRPGTTPLAGISFRRVSTGSRKFLFQLQSCVLPPAGQIHPHRANSQTV